MVRFWSTVVLCSAFLSISPASEPIDVIIVAGQSNAVGYDSAPSELPADPDDASVLFWWRCGDPPPDQHDSFSDGWTTLRPQPLGQPIKPRRDRQYGNFAQAAGGFGPEFGLGRTIVSPSVQRIAIIKVAFSGTHVAGDWNPKLGDTVALVTENDSRGGCYRSLLAETKRALAELAKKHPPRVVALVWVQGESDATAERVDQYQQNIAAMIGSLREDLNAPELIALLGVNTEFGGGNNRFLPGVIAAQKSYAAGDARAVYVDTSGVSIANQAHFDAAGTIEVGKRFAKALLDLRQRQ